MASEEYIGRDGDQQDQQCDTAAEQRAEQRQPAQAVRWVAAQRISTTLRAASTDASAAKLLRKGRLTGDIESVGFGPLLHVAPKGRRSAKAARPAKKAPRVDRRKVDAAKARLREERQALAQAEREAAAARKAAEQAERAAERAAARVEAAERRLANAAEPG